MIRTFYIMALAFATLAFTPSSSLAQTAESLQSTLIGKETVKPESVEGVWTYHKPCLAFETEATLNSLASSAVVNKGQSYLSKGMAKAGFVDGKVTLDLRSGGAAKMTIGSKELEGSYTIEGNTLSFNYTNPLTGVVKTLVTNIKVNGNTMQIAMSAKKLLALVQTASTTASSANTTLSTVSSLFGSVNGMYVGMVLKK